MGNSPGDDANNDGVNDKTGKNIFGGTNKKMTDEESEALDQEIMDLLDEEAEEKGMYSNDAEASGDFTSGRFSGDYEDDVFADDEFADMRAVAKALAVGKAETKFHLLAFTIITTGRTPSMARS